MELLSQPLQPLPGSFDAKAMAYGEPGLPTVFKWAGKDFAVRSVLRRWKSDCADRTHGSSERYRDKFWYDLQMANGEIWRVYFDRQMRSRKVTQRWILYAVLDVDEED